MFWRKWVGLPWEWGADPRCGRGACCFKTTQAAREELGMSWPSDRMGDWYARARAGHWDGLRRDWEGLTEEIEEPEVGALLRFDNVGASFGVGVLVEPEIVVTVRHQGRLIVASRRVLGPLTLYRLK